MTDRDAALLRRRLWDAEVILEDLLACFDQPGRPLTRVRARYDGVEMDSLSPSGTMVPSEIAERAASWLGKPILIVDQRKGRTDDS